jgi:hypothetical protein
VWGGGIKGGVGGGCGGGGGGVGPVLPTEGYAKMDPPPGNK